MEKTLKAHRISYEIQNGQIPEGWSVLHHCDNPICVNPVHLFIGTQLDNMRDCMAKKRYCVGEKHPSAKLRDSDIQQIIDLRNIAKMKNKEIGKIYGVDESIISEITHHKRWKHITKKKETYNGLT